MSFLGEIITNKTIQHSNLQRTRKMHSLSEAIKKTNQKGKVALIAEIKKKSPSAGTLREITESNKIAKTYEDCGATGISILTEPNYFDGSIDTLREVSQAVNLPILRKDFITTTQELTISYNLNADALLLIVAIVGAKLPSYLEKCQEIGIEALVEIHTEEELEIALNADAKIIGINNRDLTTFKIDLNTTKRLVEKIPNDKLVISESGITSPQDIEKLASYGINGVLVGTRFMKAKNLPAVVRSFSRVNYL
ncbi:MAG: indole-3-glycerol phosphate synthase TrpC [Candidatus Heimdallarchaeota archaeon]|nr:indole-3-glycerol phosphate synthase TrpC [Candidatus Heimdallarchaeota archaeon]